VDSHGLVIAGARVNTRDQDEVINPATGAPFATCARAGVEHLDAAVLAADEAFRSWRRDETLRRAKLRECAAAIRARAGELARLLTQEQGKTLALSMFEAEGSAAWFEYFAAYDAAPEVIQEDAAKSIEVQRRPLGVVAAITPWNYPLILLCWKLAPALRAGNTVVAKPSPFTPLSSLLLAEILGAVLPRGVLSVVAGDGALGAELCRHRHVRKVSFTGSVATGKKILGYAADDLKRVTLELGGNDPAIVLGDVNPDTLVEKLFWAAFQNSGQICSAIKRLYVHEDVYERVLRGLVERAQNTRMGDGLDPTTELGPINNRMQFEKLAAIVDDSRRAGAKIETGGAPLPRPGFFYPPTILTDARAGMRIVDEEQFGTALPVIPFRDVDDAIAQANGTEFGLGASVWTANPGRGAALVREIRAGSGWVNCHLDVTPATPFGGCKWSGMGVENGKWGYAEFTELQLVNVTKQPA
jgi:acyl-CoA reductase-like NAD-dependent aldehyde dehydrogenase